MGAIVGLIAYFCLGLALRRLPDPYATLLYAALIVSGFALVVGNLYMHWKKKEPEGPSVSRTTYGLFLLFLLGAGAFFLWWFHSMIGGL
ncbi:MAG: hypothetical protein PSV13_15360 [Lacunisphaera sp.]|nr:hypothetical protein [Lacunisphaera sp.]